MPAPPTDLAIIRLALVTFARKLDERWDNWTVNINEFEVQAVSASRSENRTRLLLGAITALDYRPKVASGGLVVIPEKPRRAAERAVEVAANLMAVGQGCRRWIESPWPPVVFMALGDDGRQWLDGCAGLKHGPLKSHMRTADQIDLDESLLVQLGDRDDGIALMVEALAQGHAMGRFHELIRLFERAFARPAKLLADPMVAFLHPRFGYEREELGHWFETLRDPATHADVREVVLLEPDVRPVIDRMEQAAYDVLLNKQDWRERSTTRRELWKPTTGSFRPDGSSFIQQYTTPATQGLVLDEWGTWPMALKNGTFKPRPTHWWPQGDARTSTSESFEIRILPAE